MGGAQLLRPTDGGIKPAYKENGLIVADPGTDRETFGSGNKWGVETLMRVESWV